ncbi:MAG: arginine--tRNA ligase [Clostridiales bacterium]|jgi:arginyl-tRNA synthetase|nr:arginine--tRNA ligase [Clostridiales bacterium]
MANLIQKAKEQIDSLVMAAYERAAQKGALPPGVQLGGTIEIPKDAALGDYACSYAMAAAKSMRMPPRRIADELAKELELEGSYFTNAEVAGAGFINFRLSDRWYAEVLSAVEAEGADYGRADTAAGERVMVEFVSANPTGPMTIGNARGGVLGDTLAAILDRAGHEVWREFYVNDAGNQVELFGRSIEARYLQLALGEQAVQFPEDGYHGDDIRELAQMLFDKYGDKYVNEDEQTRREAFVNFALPHNIALMEKHLERYRIRFDRFFLESDLHKSGYVEETVKLLTDNGYTYEKEGALWLRNTDFGADKDEVLRRANGFYTYYAVDIAYHRHKFIERGFDRVIDVWGADHHGHAIRFKASMTAPALGIDSSKLDFLIMQMVRLTRDGETIKVSKRTGKAITLNDLLDEISVDACRFFFNAKPDTHLEFDMGLAIRQDSENPVYYVQYAHARISSLVATLAAEGNVVPRVEEIDVSKLSSDYERELIKQISLLPEEIRLAARDYDPSRINRYVIELAARFHRFYNSNRIKGEEPELLLARLKLADTTRMVIANSLDILGVTAPEKM